MEELDEPVILLKNVLKGLPGVVQLYLTIVVVEVLSDGLAVCMVNYRLCLGCSLHRVMHSRESLK